MKKSILAFLFLASAGLMAQSQPIVKRTCGTGAPGAEWDTWFNARVAEFKANAGRQQAIDYKIPVVFHVIHGGQQTGTYPNLSQAQINSEIDVLNEDYAGIGFNVGNFSGTGFPQSLVANCNISFCLAEKDPSGNVLFEKGIHRVNYNSNGWADPASFTSSGTFKPFIDNTVKPATIWDPTRYLNIWVSDVNGNVGLLGYATFPPGSGLSGIPSVGTITDDGVWCWAKAVGDVGTLSSPFDKGRTATHEIGHWLGLRHIWGDSNCGNDYCSDTPTQMKDNTGCPSYPSITCSNGPTGDLFMNFMDYSNDACMYMFSNDQRSRMQTSMANSPLRMQLSASASTLCSSFVPCSYTLTNFSNTDTLRAYRRATAAPNDASCPQGSGLAGYITGSNCYGDLEKAEFISASKYSMVNNPVISGVVVLFFQYGNLGTDGNGNVSLNIYQGASATATPGGMLGSVVESLSNIAATTNTSSVPYCGDPALGFALPLIMPYKFNFNVPVPAPASGGFYASVTLPNSAGDTVAIMDKSTGTFNTAWEKWSDGSWHDMKTAWGNSRNFNLAILPVVDCGPVGIKEEKSAMLDQNITLFPNPTSGNFHIVTTLPSLQKLSLRVYNVLGQTVLDRQMGAVKQDVLDIDLGGHPAGVYFVELSNGSEKTVKRLLLSQ